MKKSIMFVLVIILGQSGAWAGDWFPIIASPEALTARQGHSMVTLPDGRVLLFGGEGDHALTGII